MQSRTTGLVLVLVGAAVSLWLLTGLATGRSVSGLALGFVLFSMPFLAAGLYLLLQSRGEIAQQSRADKQRSILDAVTTRGRVSVADLAIENDASRDEVRDYIYDLIGKNLFHGFVNWELGVLVSAEAARIKDDKCPQCGGRVELAGKGLVRCPYCGTETFLSGPASRTPQTPAPLPEQKPPAPL